MPSLSENEIKQLTLKFLKEYYRYRQREGGIELSSDLRGAGGIIADGFLSFPLKDGNLFQATFEATSLDTRNEVRFRRDWHLLTWDAVAVGLLLAAVVLVAGNIQGVLTFKNYTWAGCLSVVVIAALFGAMLFAAAAFGLRRYRYIYAIEQFKQYHANEQWVAIGEDVFANHYNDLYYEELRQQCIRNGFGLVVIRQNGKPLMQVTPSREDLFKVRRREISFFSQEELAAFARHGNYPKWMQKFKADDMMRFGRQRRYQLLVSIISLLAISGIFYLESQIIEELIETPEQYRARMEQVRQQNEENPQGLAYRVDTPYVWPPPFLREKDAGPYIDLSGGGGEAQPAVASKRRRQPDFLLSVPGSDRLLVYDCSRLRNIKQTFYVLQEGLYPAFAAAEGRILDLSQYELETSGLWLGCFGGADNSYVVFFGSMYNSEEEAAQALRTYQTRLADNVLGIKIEIRTISVNPNR